MKCNIAQLINSSKEISLDGYCEATDSKKDAFWLSLKRNSFNNAGVGQAKYIYAKNKYVFFWQSMSLCCFINRRGRVFKRCN